jgi:hypothetical protein
MAGSYSTRSRRGLQPSASRGALCRPRPAHRGHKERCSKHRRRGDKPREVGGRRSRVAIRIMPVVTASSSRPCLSFSPAPPQPTGMEQSRGGDCGRRTREAVGGCRRRRWRRRPWRRLVAVGAGKGGRKEEEVEEEEEAWARAAEGTREGLRHGGLDRGQEGVGDRARRRPRASVYGLAGSRGAESGGWWEQGATSSETFLCVPAGVRVPRPESGSAGGRGSTVGRTRGGRSGRRGGTRRPSLTPSLLRSCRRCRRSAAAAAPAAILGFALRRGRRSPSQLRDPPPLSLPPL